MSYDTSNVFGSIYIFGLYSVVQKELIKKTNIILIYINLITFEKLSLYILYALVLVNEVKWGFFHLFLVF